jgi:hypothetical protein
MLSCHAIEKFCAKSLKTKTRLWIIRLKFKQKRQLEPGMIITFCFLKLKLYPPQLTTYNLKPKTSLYIA